MMKPMMAIQSFEDREEREGFILLSDQDGLEAVSRERRSEWIQ
jgi:hypothetical protein